MAMIAKSPAANKDTHTHFIAMPFPLLRADATRYRHKPNEAIFRRRNNISGRSGAEHVHCLFLVNPHHLGGDYGSPPSAQTMLQ
jgi:hypothetical protein